MVTMFITVVLLLWLLLIVAEVFRNYVIILRGRPNYLFSFINRGAVAILHAVLFNPQGPADWWFVLLWQCTSFFVVFNPLLNFVRNYEFFYLGANSGWIDQFFINKPWAYRMFYGACVLATIVLTIKIYNYNFVLW